MTSPSDATDHPKPVVEPSPASADPATRALQQRIRQQEILAELGVVALQGSPLSCAIQTGICDLRSGVQRRLCAAAILGSSCPLWVKSGHSTTFDRCPLCPQKRTLRLSREMSALCQKRTLARCMERACIMDRGSLWPSADLGLPSSRPEPRDRQPQASARRSA